MKLFAIADLHMDGGAGKPMDVFGANWAGHVGRIFGSWKSKVGPGDAVLIPGDISWAMHWAEALPDLTELASLPGKKVLLRGNHDYWWGSLTRMRAQLPPGMYMVQNDCVDIGPCVIAGSRGWLTPESPDFQPMTGRSMSARRSGWGCRLLRQSAGQRRKTSPLSP